MYINSGILIGFTTEDRKQYYLQNGVDSYNYQIREHFMTGIGIGLGYQFFILNDKIVIDINGTAHAVYYTETYNLHETNDNYSRQSSPSTFLPEISCSIGYVF